MELQEFLPGLCLGGDSSRWQSPKRMTWESAPPGVSFWIVKATQDDWRDSKLGHHYAGARRFGLLAGLYHYFESDRPVRPQMEAFARAIDEHPCELPPALDQETTEDVSPRRAVESTFEALDLLERLTGRRPILYSGTNELEGLIEAASKNERKALGSYALWQAHYLRRHHVRSSKTPPSLDRFIAPPEDDGARPWKQASIWQCSSKNAAWAGLLDWYGRDLDLNVATPAALRALVDGEAPELPAFKPEPPPFVDPEIDVDEALAYNRKHATGDAVIIAALRLGVFTAWHPKKSARAVARFQAERGLAVDGKLGPQTSRVMIDAARCG